MRWMNYERQNERSNLRILEDGELTRVKHCRFLGSNQNEESKAAELYREAAASDKCITLLRSVR
jgi:gamma-glutamylcysteine synthetase